MPEMDGIELARRASELDPDLKIMFITGFAAVALNPDNHAPKDAKILSKPFHLRDLVDEVERLTCAHDLVRKVCNFSGHALTSRRVPSGVSPDIEAVRNGRARSSAV